MLNTRRQSIDTKEHVKTFSLLLQVSRTKWWLCALRHCTQNSMEAILACHPALSTKWPDGVAKSCELWRIRTGPIRSLDSLSNDQILFGELGVTEKVSTCCGVERYPKEETYGAILKKWKHWPGARNSHTDQWYQIRLKTGKAQNCDANYLWVESNTTNASGLGLWQIRTAHENLGCASVFMTVLTFLKTLGLRMYCAPKEISRQIRKGGHRCFLVKNELYTAVCAHWSKVCFAASHFEKSFLIVELCPFLLTLSIPVFHLMSIFDHVYWNRRSFRTHKNLYSSVRELSYVINSGAARAVSRTLIRAWLSLA